MIGYPISRSDLEMSIEDAKPGWLRRAKVRTDDFRKEKKYKEKSSIWSEVKHVYMALQGESKCAYCERKLESVAYGKGEQDVEHFRPKGNVKSWKLPKGLADQGVQLAETPRSGKGYYLLAYNVFNYAASCKPCNSSLKGDRFPVAGSYDLDGEDVDALKKERPYLIYPIGSFDRNPEDLIRFHGMSPQAAVGQGHDRRRALVTIEFFRLDDLNRKNLQRERAMILVLLYPMLEKLTEDIAESERSDLVSIVESCLSAKAPHSNCARSFKRLYDGDRTEARALYDRALALIISTS